MNFPARGTDLLNPLTGSHPAIQFTDFPMVDGTLPRFNGIRGKVLDEVIHRTMDDFTVRSDEALEEALFLERARLDRNSKLSPTFFFTYPRRKNDLRLWRWVRSELKKSRAETDRREVLKRVLSHYAEEVGGEFDPKVYRFATHAIPFAFNWLLNAASLHRFVPWKMPESLQSRLHIVGQVGSLQKLSQKGTILLVPTHQSNIDSMLIGYVIHLMRLPPFSYGAGLNLFTNPVFSFLMSRLGAYKVDRQKSSNLYKGVLKNYSTTILKEGVHSIFFPGGGRCRNGAIENHLKLGLLGTGLQAQLENLAENKPNSSIFVVPMVMSYHFVFEASSLIADYLASQGKQRFFGTDAEDPWPLLKTIRFFWKFFSEQGAFTVRIGAPMDVFGNLVDDEGQSYSESGIPIDPKKRLITRGELRSDPQRDREYVQNLGKKVAHRFHLDNTVLTSHLVAFSFFMALRRKYPDYDLYRFIRLTAAQRSLPYAEFLKEASKWHGRVKKLASEGRVYLSPEVGTWNLEKWIEDGMRHLGAMHDNAVIKMEDGIVFTEDMGLLYYYRNRLTGYGLVLDIEGRDVGFPGDYDEKGFLV